KKVGQNRRLQLVGKIGGPGRDRTDDLFHAMEARSQLRHRPTSLIQSIREGEIKHFVVIVANLRNFSQPQINSGLSLKSVFAASKLRTLRLDMTAGLRE